MSAFLRRTSWRTSVISNLIAGSLVILPFVLTVLIIGWGINWIMAAFGPGSWFGNLLTTGGEAFIGPEREWLAFLIGTVIVLIILWLIGLAVRTRAQRTFQHVLDDVLAKVPLFRAVYRPVSQVVRLFAGSNPDLSRLPVVMCRIGGTQGVDVPAFLASDKTYRGRGRTAPPCLPADLAAAGLGRTGAGAEDAVIPVPEMDADALIKLYFSFGVLAPETIPNVTGQRSERSQKQKSRSAAEDRQA